MKKQKQTAVQRSFRWNTAVCYCFFSRRLQTVKNRIVISDDLQNDQLKNTCKIIKRDNLCKTDFSFCINENTKRVHLTTKDLHKDREKR